MRDERKLELELLEPDDCEGSPQQAPERPAGCANAAGYADFVIAQKEFGWVDDVVRLAHDMVSEQREPPTFYDSGCYTVCDSNFEQSANMWREQDFRGELPACAWLE